MTSSLGGGGLGGAHDPDSYYVQDCREVQANTHAIQTLTGQISRQVGALESERDFSRCRGMVDDAVRQATQTRSVLLRIREHQQQAQTPAERNNRRMMHQKLSDNLAITARVLEDVVRRFQSEEARRAHGAGRHVSVSSDADAAGGEELAVVGPGAGLGMGGAKQQQAAACAMDDELEADRCHALRRVDEDMRCLQRLYTDLANAAGEQQSSFDSLESHLAAAAADVERGREEIQYTSRHAWGPFLRQKAVTYGVTAVAAVGVLGYLTSG